MWKKYFNVAFTFIWVLEKNYCIQIGIMALIEKGMLNILFHDDYDTDSHDRI
jgi:hypothetical protein